MMSGTTIEDDQEVRCELLALPDLVQARKTRRGKDWPMLQRLVEAHYPQHRTAPLPGHPEFWLRESRTPEVLIGLAASYPDMFRDVMPRRPLLTEALGASQSALQQALQTEQAREREADETYWRPLKRELEALRRAKRKRED